MVSTIYFLKDPKKFYNQALCVAANDGNTKPRQSWQSEKSNSDHYVPLLRQDFLLTV